ncbi:MAG: transcriptional regulator, AraC family [Collimonas fungivorans]|uniref:AraC family transcriptional regulator n=1 Tax=Collimonas fungivorans TaxID=158899 RepID=UPI0026EF7C3D|nr:AraC family transcriptional regulator [Collimonas fungivorans]MDB5767135.1 transcriptional regulator, AraC family [Collimonas fungivorans]
MQSITTHPFSSMPSFQQTPSCILEPGTVIPRHVHAQAYATIVLDGGYQEAGERGRWHVRAGDVLLHAPFSAHWNRAIPRGARVLNLPVAMPVAESACGQVADPDLVIRLAGRDSLEAAAALTHGWRQSQGKLSEAPDLLAEALTASDPAGVQLWSLEHGVSRVTAFRWFRAVYGVSPTRYRIEARARLAWRMIVDGGASLIEIAAAAGYADQAHMNRDVKAFTGRSPGAWRSTLKHSFKTAAAAA